MLPEKCHMSRRSTMARYTASRSACVSVRASASIGVVIGAHAHCSSNNQQAGLGAISWGYFYQTRQTACNHRLRRACSVAHDSGRCVGCQPMAEQLLCNLRQALHTHLESTRLPRLRHSPPVVRSIVSRKMTWQKHTAAGKVAVRQWNARSRWEPSHPAPSQKQGLEPARPVPLTRRGQTHKNHPSP